MAKKKIPRLTCRNPKCKKRFYPKKKGQMYCGLPCSRSMSKNGGRKPIMNDKKVALLEEAFKLGCTDKEAMFNADIKKDTFYRYMDAHPEFRERREVLKQNPFYIARKSIVNFLDTDPRLAMEFMKSKKSEEFNSKVNLSLTDNTDKPQYDYSDLSKDELRTLIALHEKAQKKDEPGNT